MKRIKYLAKWIPILWNNYHPWDYGYLLNMMIEKLKEMETYFSTSSQIDRKEEVVEIRLFRKSLERIVTEDYTDGQEMDAWTRFAREQELLESDVEFAGNQLKKLLNWWD